MTQEFDYTCHAQLHIIFNDVLSAEQSEVLEDQLAFFLGALGLKGSIHSDVTWNDTAFPLDYESENPVNSDVIEEVLVAVSIEANEAEGSQPLVGHFNEAYWCSEEEENEDFAEDGFVRDIGDWLRESDEADLD